MTHTYFTFLFPLLTWFFSSVLPASRVFLFIYFLIGFVVKLKKNICTDPILWKLGHFEIDFFIRNNKMTLPKNNFCAGWGDGLVPSPTLLYSNGYCIYSYSGHLKLFI